MITLRDSGCRPLGKWPRNRRAGPSRAGPPASSRNGASSGPFLPRADVARLLVGHGIQLHTQRLQLEAGDLAIDLLRHRVDLWRQLGMLLHGVLRRERLACE